MAELLAYLARELVDDPDAVRVETEEREGSLVLVLHVAPDGVLVIGFQLGRGYELEEFDGRGARVLSVYLEVGPERQPERSFQIAFKDFVKEARAGTAANLGKAEREH